MGSYGKQFIWDSDPTSPPPRFVGNPQEASRDLGSGSGPVLPPRWRNAQYSFAETGDSETRVCRQSSRAIGRGSMLTAAHHEASSP